jgi:hypothetical protein
VGEGKGEMYTTDPYLTAKPIKRLQHVVTQKAVQYTISCHFYSSKSSSKSLMLLIRSTEILDGNTQLNS